MVTDRYINLNDNSSDMSWKIRLSALKKISLDDILENLLITYIDDQEELERQRKIIDLVEYIVKTYLTNKEQLIYYLVIHMNKKVSEIMKIAGFDGWRTTNNNVERVFKMIRLYYQYETLDHKKLNKIINKNFTPFEKKIIDLLEKRYTIHEVKDEIGFRYAKTYTLIKNIMERLSKLPTPCDKYYLFLVEIRKFKKLKDYNIIKDGYIKI